MRILLLFLLFYANILSAMTLKERFSGAQPGDYIITEQGKSYSILFVRSASEKSLILEEVTLPESAAKSYKNQWAKLLEERAPGHTSWISYELDLEKNLLKESYSYTQNSWLYIQDADYLLARLLNLPLARLQEAERKKIGPAPLSGDVDTRAAWTPSLFVEGSKVSKPKCEVWRGTWPEDGTLLAGCDFELYFDALRPSFPFPVWLEVKSTHYALKMRTVDTGSGLVSPMPLLPSRTPIFFGLPKKEGNLFEFTLDLPSYSHKPRLFVIDLSSENQTPIPIPVANSGEPQRGRVTLSVRQSDLQKILICGHSYRWVTMADEGGTGYAEIAQPFLWNETSYEQSFRTADSPPK